MTTMKLSHLFSFCLFLLLAVPSHARLLKHPIIPRLQCLTRMYFFDFQVDAFDKYNTTYFGDDSTMTLAQAGTYYKADGIEEYVKFAYGEYSVYQKSGPVYGRKRQAVRYRGYNYKTGECKFLLLFNGAYEMDPTYTSSDAKFDLAYMGKFYFDFDQRYLRKADIFYPEAFLADFFGSFLNSTNTREYICDVMRGPCEDYIDTPADCEAQLAALPIAESPGLQVDGNSKGCRALHAIFASTNSENHCPHISFTPKEDPNGDIKCQETKGVKPSDLFNSKDMKIYRKFCRKQGIDPSVGMKYISGAPAS